MRVYHQYRWWTQNNPISQCYIAYNIEFWSQMTMSSLSTHGSSFLRRSERSSWIYALTWSLGKTIDNYLQDLFWIDAKVFFQHTYLSPNSGVAVMTWYKRHCLKVLVWSAKEHKLSMLTFFTRMKNHMWANTDFVYWKTEKLGRITIVKLALCNFCQTFHYTFDNVLRYCILRAWWIESLFCHPVPWQEEPGNAKRKWYPTRMSIWGWRNLANNLRVHWLPLIILF